MGYLRKGSLKSLPIKIEVLYFAIWHSNKIFQYFEILYLNNFKNSITPHHIFRIDYFSFLSVGK